MEIRSFCMTGKWIRAYLDDDGAHIHINPDDTDGNADCLASCVKTKEELVDILNDVIIELADLKRTLTNDGEICIWGRIPEKVKDDEETGAF